VVLRWRKRRWRCTYCHSYDTVICDILERYVLDTIEGRHVEPLVRWFSDLDPEVRQGIEVVVMDLSSTYRSIVAEMLPHAVRVADKFHVIRLANLALDRARALSHRAGGPSARPGGRAGCSSAASYSFARMRTPVQMIPSDWR
jgi:transposase